MSQLHQGLLVKVSRSIIGYGAGAGCGLACQSRCLVVALWCRTVHWKSDPHTHTSSKHVRHCLIPTMHLSTLAYPWTCRCKAAKLRVLGVSQTKDGVVVRGSMGATWALRDFRQKKLLFLTLWSKRLCCACLPGFSVSLLSVPDWATPCLGE